MFYEKIGEVGNGFGGNCDVFECDEINALPNAVPFSRAFIYSDEGIDVAMHSSKGFWVDTKGTKKFDTFIPEVIAENGTVTFTKDGEEVEELTYGDTVTVTVTADSGYQVKTITLNGEEIENNSEFTVDGDILLIAEFEEAGEEVIYEKTLTFAKEGELSTTTHAIDLETSLESLGFIEGQNYTMKIGDLSLDCVGFSTGSGITIANPDVESQMKWFIMPWTEEGSIFISYYAAAGELFTGERLVKIVKAEAPAPSGYTWDGEAVEGDLVIEDVGVLHKVSDDKFLPEDLVGGTVTFNLNPETQEETPGTYTIVSGDPSTGEIAVGVSEDTGFTEIGSFGSFYSGEGSLGEYSLNGTYFLKLIPLGGVFITELNPPTE